jgi:hypothetical protein
MELLGGKLQYPSRGEHREPGSIYGTTDRLKKAPTTRLTAEQMARLRGWEGLKAKIKLRGRINSVMPALFRMVEICQRDHLNQAVTRIGRHCREFGIQGDGLARTPRRWRDTQ